MSKYISGIKNANLTIPPSGNISTSTGAISSTTINASGLITANNGLNVASGNVNITPTTAFSFKHGDVDPGATGYNSINSSQFLIAGTGYPMTAENHSAQLMILNNAETSGASGTNSSGGIVFAGPSQDFGTDFHIAAGRIRGSITGYNGTMIIETCKGSDGGLYQAVSFGPNQETNFSGSADFLGVGSTTASSATIYSNPASTTLTGASSYFFNYFNSPTTTVSTFTGTASTVFIAGAPTVTTGGTGFALNVNYGTSRLQETTCTTLSASSSLTISNSTNTTNLEMIQLTNSNTGDPLFRLIATKGTTTNNSGDIMSRIGLHYSTTNANAFIRFHRGASTTGGFMSFTTNNDTERMRIDGSGNVGIGTTNPLARLDLGSTTTARKLLIVSGSNNDYQFTGFGSTGNIDLVYQVDNPVADHIFYAGTSSTTSQELFRIKGNRNVQMQSTAVLEFGVGITKETNAGKIGYQTFSGNALDIVGAGTSSGSRKVTLYDNVEISSRLIITNGVIQRGGADITATTDLGLYSRTSGNFIRYVTNAADHVWFNTEGANGIGSQEAMRIFNNWFSSGTALRVAGRIIIATTGGTTPGDYGWVISTAYPDTFLENLEFATYDDEGYIVKGFIEDDDNTSYRMNDFTGSHRCKYNIENPNNKIGLIAISTGEYCTVVKTEKNTDVKTGKDAITIFDSLPIVELCAVQNDKRCFGVISGLEDPNQKNRGTGIGFKASYVMPEGDQRLEINAVGEGAIWVCNINGNIENGDYISSSNVPGYGMNQISEFLVNYTVAKSTCDVNFSNLEELKQKYQVRFLESDGSIITEEVYLLDTQDRYIAAFIGCTYHCG